VLCGQCDGRWIRRACRDGPRIGKWVAGPRLGIRHRRGNHAWAAGYKKYSPFAAQHEQFAIERPQGGVKTYTTQKTKGCVGLSYEGGGVMYPSHSVEGLRERKKRDRDFFVCVVGGCSLLLSMIWYVFFGHCALPPEGWAFRPLRVLDEG